MINFGSRPTFGGNETLLEAHIADFNGDLYGQNLTVFFDYYLRDIRKFFSEEELKKQLKTDLDAIR